MFEILIGAVVVVSIIVVARVMIGMKRAVLIVQQHATTRFFDHANALVDSGHLTEEHRLRLLDLSETITSRKLQFRMMMALRDLQRDLQRDLRRPTPPQVAESVGSLLQRSLPADLQGKWSSLMFNWMVAVNAQGSVLGYGTLELFIEYVDQPKEKFVRRAEAFASNAFAH